MRSKTVLMIFSVVFVGVVTFVYAHNVGKHCEALNANATRILVDAGHGGPDNGACAADGTPEDGINLAVSLQLYDLLRFCGFSVDMTRTEDTVVTDDAVDVSRGWKVNDMYARLRQYDDAAFTVSIHQNHFSQAKYHGTQVFYGTKHTESQVLAENIQKQVVTLVQPQNTRTIKAAGENIFLLSRTTQPAVIVECGFLSNPTEAKQLKNPQYQQLLAFSIGCGILEYTAKG